MRRADLPFAARGQVIGILGGSFDPAHEGHVAITHAALRRFGLDAVWWLASPGNPLKAHQPAPMADRISRARHLMRHPRVLVTDLEARIGTRYTAQTLRRLVQLYPGVRFVWLMGADNLAQFHRWEDWRGIADLAALGVLARPGQQMAALNSVAARVLSSARLPQSASARLGRAPLPAWCFVTLPMVDASSSAIRAAQRLRVTTAAPSST
ncbi:nicotinate-nucleotide adenylyltransferase [Szabonella alba]|uniref:Probable nicotinate-nucleotide adenylyltransferase n=1 Tax=Szabonella alba TaxID=2804194 RepID=A0A8K0XYZ5_9RHOB|nr:nicotinate-nucleotide adenylyltransferase [Szabonella alba]MBL4916261.1 nicotinate-nucleotide adenylyltransferase [Szabonella alba]